MSETLEALKRALQPKIEERKKAEPKNSTLEDEIATAKKDLIRETKLEILFLDFSEALLFLKRGKKIYRNGWNGKDMYLYFASQELKYPPLPNKGEAWKECAFEKSNFIIMKTADNKLIPWLASQTDILAEDWKIN